MEAQSIRVLVVDDRSQDIALLARTIEALASDVSVVGTATDGPEAIALAEKEDFDVAVVDYRMPGMDGLAVAERLKSLHPDSKVVILTAYDDARETIESHPSVDAFLEKLALDRIGDVLEEVTGRTPPAPASRGGFFRRK
jgi:two-component system LytT family response regulator/two-component system response regulator AlgR